MNDLIEEISKYLKGNYPEVKFRNDGQDEMVIFSKTHNGFEIFIQQEDRENTIHVNTWHFHFEVIKFLMLKRVCK